MLDISSQKLEQYECSLRTPTTCDLGHRWRQTVNVAYISERFTLLNEAKPSRYHNWATQLSWFRTFVSGSWTSTPYLEYVENWHDKRQVRCYITAGVSLFWINGIRWNVACRQNDRTSVAQLWYSFLYSLRSAICAYCGWTSLIVSAQQYDRGLEESKPRKVYRISSTVLENL